MLCGNTSHLLSHLMLVTTPQLDSISKEKAVPRVSRQPWIWRLGETDPLGIWTLSKGSPWWEPRPAVACSGGRWKRLGTGQASTGL